MSCHVVMGFVYIVVIVYNESGLDYVFEYVMGTYFGLSCIHCVRDDIVIM